MDNHEALNLLEKSWSKQNLLEKIKKGQSAHHIVEEFIKENKNSLETVINLLSEKDDKILRQLEVLANCEIKLINELKIKENKVNIKIDKEIVDVNPIIKLYKEFSLSLFMKKWSNQFVIGILIMISIISITKQAWA